MSGVKDSLDILNLILLFGLSILFWKLGSVQKSLKDQIDLSKEKIKLEKDRLKNEI
jgi:hypothetical protein